MCDEVDLERGVRVQRVNTYKPTEVNLLQSINSYGIANFNISHVFSDALTIDSSKLFLVNRFALQKSLVASTQNEGMLINSAGVGFFRIKQETANTVDSMNAWLSRNDVIVYYVLATPIETPLTPAEITAYKALTTYAPDTVVQATDGAGLEATYKCNVRKAEKTINDLYAELTAELEA